MKNDKLMLLGIALMIFGLCCTQWIAVDRVFGGTGIIDLIVEIIAVFAPLIGFIVVCIGFFKKIKYE